MNERIAEAMLMRSIREHDVLSTINALRRLITPIDSCDVEKLETGRQVSDEYLWVKIDGKVRKREFVGALRYALTVKHLRHTCSN